MYGLQCYRNIQNLFNLKVIQNNMFLYTKSDFLLFVYFLIFFAKFDKFCKKYVIYLSKNSKRIKKVKNKQKIHKFKGEEI